MTWVWAHLDLRRKEQEGADSSLVTEENTFCSLARHRQGQMCEMR